MTGWATLGTGQTVELASPGARLGARVLDWIITVAVIFLLVALGIAGAVSSTDADSGEGAGLGLGVLLIFGLLAMLFGVVYEVSMTALKGQTLGKMATSVKVVRADNGALVGWGKAIGRWLIPALLSLIPFIGWLLSLLVFVSLTWDRTRQGWHDKAAGTIVIKA